MGESFQEFLQLFDGNFVFHDRNFGFFKIFNDFLAFVHYLETRNWFVEAGNQFVEAGNQYAEARNQFVEVTFSKYLST